MALSGVSELYSLNRVIPRLQDFPLAAAGSQEELLTGNYMFNISLQSDDLQSLGN